MLKVTYAIDNAKHYKTRGGSKVTIHETVLRNSAGDLVSFPVKCSIRKNKKNARSRYQILTLDGRAGCFGEHQDDIVSLWDVRDLA